MSLNKQITTYNMILSNVELSDNDNVNDTDIVENRCIDKNDESDENKNNVKVMEEYRSYLFGDYLCSDRNKHDLLNNNASYR